MTAGSRYRFQNERDCSPDKKVGEQAKKMRLAENRKKLEKR
jgi:hypothetical protein